MKKILPFLLLFYGFISTAQTAGDIAQKFGSSYGFDNSVYVTVLQPDGKMIVGGLFTAYKGLTENCIIRLNSDGTKDTTFITGTGFNNTVNSIALQPDGKILVGGVFTTYKGVTENYIIRLNADGTNDTSFTTGTGFNNIIRTMIIQPDGKIIVGGNFTSYNGATENRIIRLNTTGSKDTTFTTGIGFDSPVLSLVVQSDGKIIVGGSFTTYKGITENRIIRLNVDGTKDTTFTTGTGFNNPVRTIAIQPDGKILAGGDFTSYNGVTENRIVCLNTDGTKDSSFITSTGFNALVYTITIQLDGKILVSGDFKNYQNSIDSSFLIKLYGQNVLSTAGFNENNVFTIYPNPVSDVVKITSSNNEIESIKIYNLQGKLMLETSANIVNVSNFTNGFYLAKIKTNNGEETKKFIKE